MVGMITTYHPDPKNPTPCILAKDTGGGKGLADSGPEMSVIEVTTNTGLSIILCFALLPSVHRRCALTLSGK